MHSNSRHVYGHQKGCEFIIYIKLKKSLVCFPRPRKFAWGTVFDNCRFLIFFFNFCFAEYFKSFLLCFYILLLVPLSNARSLTKMAAKDHTSKQESLYELCGMQRRRLNLTEIERMINRTLLLCSRAIVEAERTGDNYVSINSCINFTCSYFLKTSE